VTAFVSLHYTPLLIYFIYFKIFIALKIWGVTVWDKNV